MIFPGLPVRKFSLSGKRVKSNKVQFVQKLIRDEAIGFEHPNQQPSSEPSSKQNMDIRVYEQVL